MKHEQDSFALDHMKSPYLQLFIILIGTFMAVLDNSIVNVAIPTMETALNANTDQIQWVITGYMLVSGVVVPISGWLTDRFGSKTIFIFSMATFTIGSALCGMAWNLPTMIFFRILQASGGGFMMPVANAMIFKIFPPEKRGSVMGIFGLAIMAAPAFGPLLSGYFVEYASWRLIFYINVPIGIVGTFLSFFFLYKFPHQNTSKLDYWGFTLSTVGLFSLLYGFNNVSAHGWGSLQVYPFIIAGVALVLALIAVELMIENPVLQLRVLKNYLFAMSLMITSILQVALFVGLFLLPLYLQNIMGYTALRTGLFMTPAALASAVFMLVGGRLFNKTGARPIAIIGLAILCYASYGFTSLQTDSTSAHIQTLYILRSVGMGLTMMPVMTAGMNLLPLKYIGQASAMGNAVRLIASSLGTAVLTSYMSTQTNLNEYQMDSLMTPYSPQGLQLKALETSLMHMGVPPYAVQNEALMIVSDKITGQSFVNGLNDTFMVATILTLIALCLTFFFSSKKREGVAPPQGAQMMME